MDYLGWVARVADTFAHTPKRFQQSDIASLAKALGLMDSSGQLPREPHAALHNALVDLEALSVLEMPNELQLVENENTRRMRAGARLESTWEHAFDPFLESEQLAFLVAAAALSEHQEEAWADVQWITAEATFIRLGWSTSERSDLSRAHEICNILEDGRLIRTRRTAGSLSALALRPTYRGVVRATQQAATEWRQRLAAMVSEWETVTVDFKEALPLNSARQKAEFIKDVMGLATTKASGDRRHMVVGYSDRTRQFTSPLEGAMSEDRLESLVNAYIAPPQPRLRLIRVPSGAGEVGVVELTRDPRHVPYRVSKAIQKLRVGDVFVRHGTHSARPDAEELADLEAEARRARAARDG